MGEVACGATAKSEKPKRKQTRQQNENAVEGNHHIIK
jgi:hypothetical protein